MILRKINSPEIFLFLGILIILSVVLFYGIAIEPYSLDIRHIAIHDTHLANLLGDKIVVQLSDLHVGDIGKLEQKILDMLRDIQPDYIFLTGDYVKWKGDYEAALNFMSKLEAKEDIYAVLGDYDYSNSRKSCLFCHKAESGEFTERHVIHFLRNSGQLIDTEKGYVRIIGLEKKDEETFSLSLFLKNLHVDEPLIILCHSPLVFDHLSITKPVLILAGDTHGGQIPLPSWIFKVLGYEKNATYNEGIFAQGSKVMYVSRGIGTSHLPIRILRRPEIVVLHFSGS
jgi:hypothetical protein